MNNEGETVAKKTRFNSNLPNEYFVHTSPYSFAYWPLVSIDLEVILKSLEQRCSKKKKTKEEEVSL